MSEQIVQVENVNPNDLYGANDQHLTMIKNLFPKIKIIARGDFIKVIGKDEEVEYFINRLNLLTLHLERYGNITSKVIEEVMLCAGESDFLKNLNDSEVLVYGRNGLQIKPMTVNQKLLVKSCEEKDMVFAIGPAGTGKTYTAVALAVRALKNKEVRRIILTRPAVEAGENLGFLPGDLKEKLDPYLQPLYDALRDMLPQSKLQGYMEDGTIEIAPLAFMRGRTLDHAFVILDEAQNATRSQLKMFLTRMGRSAKFVITGDITQIDLPKNQPSGLPQAMEVLKDVKGIDFIYLNEKDVVRHKLVTDIVNAYKRYYSDNDNETVSSQPTDVSGI
ncbi:MAG: PhoH family protein [Bacteroidales bacterium]|nr:PhoH family protein [Lentimicrobiaceae bacterium]MBQ2907913.1 PhoH family protein [Bacteroidales bacterium]MBQ3595505.1 PhoH family protein [Bacteroidales bacterium]